MIFRTTSITRSDALPLLLPPVRRTTFTRGSGSRSQGAAALSFLSLTSFRLPSLTRSLSLERSSCDARADGARRDLCCRGSQAPRSPLFVLRSFLHSFSSEQSPSRLLIVDVKQSSSLSRCESESKKRRRRNAVTDPVLRLALLTRSARLRRLSYPDSSLSWLLLSSPALVCLPSPSLSLCRHPVPCAVRVGWQYFAEEPRERETEMLCHSVRL